MLLNGDEVRIGALSAAPFSAEKLELLCSMASATHGHHISSRTAVLAAAAGIALWSALRCSAAIGSAGTPLALQTLQWLRQSARCE